MHFQPRFSANKHTLISFVPLDNIKQRVNESFRQYMDRFVKTSLNIFFFRSRLCTQVSWTYTGVVFSIVCLQIHQKYGQTLLAKTYYITIV